MIVVAFAATIAVTLTGCITTANLPARPLLECPPPVVLCQPGSFVPASRPAFNVTVERVQGLNTGVDEFGVTFPPGSMREAVSTHRQGGADRMMSVRFIRVTEAVVEGPLDVSGIKGSIGSPDFATSALVAFAAKYPESIKGDYDLFTGKYASKSVSSPDRLPISADVSWDSQPTLSPDGNTLYFASDRKGGHGANDIYVSRKQADGQWSEPVALGPGVNTGCDELSPFVTGDGRWLYFASSGHETMGGYDIFRAPIVGTEVGRATNLGLPVNTAADELFPSAPSTANPDTLMYFSSNQPGSNRFDIYVLHRVRKGGPIAENPTRETADSVKLVGTVRDPAGRPIDGAIVTVEQRDPPGPTDSLFTNKEGEFDVEIREGRVYVVTAGSPGHLYGTDSVYVPTANNLPEVRRDITLPDTVTFRINFPFDNATDPYEFTLDDNGMPTNERWTDVIDRAALFLRGFPKGSGTIEVVGHTDPYGTDAFNIDLGRRRAEFVKRELVKRGVDPSVLTPRSEGEGHPLPMRTGEEDEIYRARLRRVELVKK